MAMALLSLPACSHGQLGMVRPFGNGVNAQEAKYDDLPGQRRFWIAPSLYPAVREGVGQ